MATVAVANEVSLDSENIVEFTVSVGDKLQLCPPIARPAITFSKDQSDKKKYRKGFIVLNDKLGEFTAEDGDCVIYQHNKSGKQIIQYASAGIGEMSYYAIIDGITVHDHASIYQGGPAFATYYAEVPKEE